MRTLLICLLVSVTVAFAQDKPAAAVAQGNPLIAFNKDVYAGVKGILLRSAEKMPEENYNFKPTDSVRSYGQIIGHVADAQYFSVPWRSASKIPGQTSRRPNPRK